MPEGLTEDDLAEMAARFGKTREGLASLVGDAQFRAFASKALLDVAGGPTPGRLQALALGRGGSISLIEDATGFTLIRNEFAFGKQLANPFLSARDDKGRFSSLQAVADKIRSILGG